MNCKISQFNFIINCDIENGFHLIPPLPLYVTQCIETFLFVKHYSSQPRFFNGNALCANNLFIYILCVLWYDYKFTLCAFLYSCVTILV